MKKLYTASLLVVSICAAQPSSAQCGPTITCPANITTNSSPGICGAVVNYAPATATTSCSGAVTVYSEDFQTGINGWTLNVNTGTNASTPNSWEVNDSEGGVAPPGCGVATNGDLTLHITCTSQFCGSLITGAVYNATKTSNKRAESPAINTTGYSGLTLNFNYISMGDGLLDNASVVYNDGSGWQVLTASIKSAVCGSGQGQWTAYTASLPSSCNNNANLKIGFNWTNNADNIGTDPSVAINNITISTAGSPPPVITYNIPSGTQFPVGTTTVTATATDFLNNTANCSFLVTVNDNESPVISSCPSSITVPANNAGCTAVVNWNVPVATDNCTVASMISNFNSGAIFPLGSTSVNYTATDNSGNASVCNFVVTVTNPVSVAISSSMATTECEGNTDTLIASGASTYLWSTSSVNDTIVITQAPGITQWTVTGTDANGCTGSDTVNVIVSDLLTVNANMSAVDTQCVSNAQVNLSSIGIPGGGVWSGPGVTGMTFDPFAAGAGTHLLTYTVYNMDSCESSASGTIYVDNCLGIINSPDENPVLLYPNPNNGSFVLESGSDAVVEIYNAAGGLVHTQNAVAGINNVVLENAADGIYLVKITGESSIQFVRVVKGNQ